MGRKGDTPSRSEVTDTVEKHKGDMSEKVDELEIIAQDKETVTSTLESLDLSGTTEGSDAVEEAIEQAENATVEVFEGEDAELEAIQSDTEEYEGQLQERTDSNEADLEKIADAANKIETQETVGELEKAKDATSSDMEFLQEQNEAAQQAREETDRLQEQHRSRVQAGRS
jgi:hypothetical protein